MTRTRFVDKGRSLASFADDFLVRCPRCQATARVSRPWNHEARRWQAAKVVCRTCGFARGEDATSWSGPVTLHIRCRCGHCGRRIHLTRPASATPPDRTLAVRCDGCGHTTDTTFSTSPRRVPDNPADECFGLPLALRTPCAGHTFWAFNPAHLAYLKDFLQADLRERTPTATNRSVASRLPPWLKQRRHRGEALRAVARLERLLTA
jgi:hypothetical protein